MPEHVTITDPDIHEPKGASSANVNEVYIADGAGSGDWTEIKSAVPLLVHGTIQDISTAETVYIPTPFAGSITKIVTVIDAAITVADATITIKNSAGTTIDTLTITQSGSAAGDVDAVDITTGNTFTEDSFLTIETDAASSTSSKLDFTLVLERD